MPEFAEYQPSRKQRRRRADPVVRAAVVRDVPALAAISAARQGTDVATARAGFERELALLLDGLDGCLLVAVRDCSTVAFGRARRFQPPADAPGDCAPAGYYLGGVVVAPDHRRMGIATRLTEARLAWVAERADEVFYISTAQNRVSLELHRRLGFEEVTRAFTYPGVEFTGGVGVLSRLALGATPSTDSAAKSPGPERRD